MSALHRKLFRDLWSLRGQAMAIALVIGSGVAMFLMSLCTLQSLQLTRQTYYERYRFGDVFAQLKRAPLALSDQIAEIPGVAQVQTRVVVDVTLDVEGLPEPAVGRLISIPERGEPTLNAVHLRRGRYIEEGRKGEVLASEAFADAHGLEPGDSVKAVINGQLQELRIVGIALSPEYVFQMSGRDLLPDDRRFGVFWMGYTDLSAVFNMEGGFNDVSLALLRGASEPEVIRRMDRLIEPYGGVRSYARDDQLSHRYLSDEIRQLQGMGLVTPVIFLSVAAFLINVVLSRIVNTQREQIAELKAFGYTNRQVGGHYLEMVLLIVIGGVLLGTVAGAWLARNLTELYTRFYRFPVFYFRFDASIVVLGFLISAAAAVLGAVGAVRKAVRLPPAEAMRPEPPAVYRPTFVERTGLGSWLPHAVRMILRRLERRPLKALLSTLGIAMAVAVLILGNFGADAVEFLMDFQFQVAQRHDVSVTFVEPSSAQAVYDVKHLPGVMQCEPYRALAVRLRHGPRNRELAIMGLDPNAELFRLINGDGKLVGLPPEGLIISEKLGELLQVHPGESITVEVLEGKRPVMEIPVAGMIADYSGTNAYMNLASLRERMQEGQTVTGAFLTVDSGDIDELYATLKRTPRIAGVSIVQAALESFRKTMAENILIMTTFNVIFAAIIAFGVVYNMARISLAEGSRDLATLRVIGFTRGEVSAILLGELAVITAAAIPVGLLMGYGFAALLSLTLDTELYRIPLVVDRSTFAFAAVVTIMASLISGLVVRRRIDRLDLVSVLKARE